MYQIQIPARLQFFLHLEKNNKVFGKNTVTSHNFAYMVKDIVTNSL